MLSIMDKYSSLVIPTVFILFSITVTGISSYFGITTALFAFL